MLFRLLAVSAATLMLALPPFAIAQTPAAPASVAAPAAPAAAAVAAPQDASAAVSEGKVATYGRKFKGRKTANGERFNPAAMTMAHKTLPFGTLVKVTNLSNKASVVVRVNDRGPTTPDRVGDLSTAAAAKIKMLRAGVVMAKLEVVGTAKGKSKAKSGARKAKKA